mmetsp:Transcript_41159/g.106372  ORF Transcript_41159/g.106372 Transcript_41159/m.106372 type:complete len:247 (-) Transcript_41159:661-1401(-)
MLHSHQSSAEEGFLLSAAMNTCITDMLWYANDGGISIDMVQTATKASTEGTLMLVGGLVKSGVCLYEGGRVRMSPLFRSVYPFRDVLGHYLDFSLSAGAYAISGFDGYRNIFQSGRADGGETVRLALVPHMSSEVHVTEKYTLRFYKLDGYRVMSSLTRLISPSVCPFLGLTHVRNIMDIGGNSGEFLLQVLRCNEARGIKQGRIVDTDFIREYGRLNIRDEEPEWFAEGKIDYLNHTVCLFKGDF